MGIIVTVDVGALVDRGVLGDFGAGVSDINLSSPQATNKIIVTMKNITYINTFSVINAPSKLRRRRRHIQMMVEQ
jgi:hypothetical protein